VRDTLLIEARNTGWAVGQFRKLRDTTEVRVAFSPGNLPHFLQLSRQADEDGLFGAWREAFFLSRVPNHPTARLPARSSQLHTFIDRERTRLTATRLSRDYRFAPLIKEQFAHSCALCGLQLEIVEAAHIIPIREAHSRDQVWNGLALYRHEGERILTEFHDREIRRPRFWEESGDDRERMRNALRYSAAVAAAVSAS
jgi:putative restriction endonuclease